MMTTRGLIPSGDVQSISRMIVSCSPGEASYMLLSSHSHPKSLRGVTITILYTDQGGDCRGNSKNGSSTEQSAVTKHLVCANPNLCTSCAVVFILATTLYIL